MFIPLAAILRILPVVHVSNHGCFSRVNRARGSAQMAEPEAEAEAVPSESEKGAASPKVCARVRAADRGSRAADEWMTWCRTNRSPVGGPSVGGRYKHKVRELLKFIHICHPDRSCSDWT